MGVARGQVSAHFSICLAHLILYVQGLAYVALNLLVLGSVSVHGTVPASVHADDIIDF